MDCKIKQIAWDADTLAAMAPCVAVNPWGADTMEVLGGSQLYTYDHGTEHLMLAAKGIRRGDVTTLEITGLVSLAGRMQTSTADDALDTLANIYQADKMAFFTPHAHLHRGALRLGFAESGRLFLKQVQQHGRQ